MTYVRKGWIKCYYKRDSVILLFRSIICLPPGSQSVPNQAQLLSMTNSGSGFGYPLGSNSSGYINCPNNFSSQDELLQHLRGYFGSLSSNNIPCSFYKRTQGLGIRQISFSSFRELRQAVGRGALVIVPDSSPGPCNGHANTFFPSASRNQIQNQIPVQPNSLDTFSPAMSQTNPSQVSPYFSQPASLFSHPVTPVGVSATPFSQPQLFNTLTPGSHTTNGSFSAASVFPTGNGSVLFQNNFPPLQGSSEDSLDNSQTVGNFGQNTAFLPGVNSLQQLQLQQQHQQLQQQPHVQMQQPRQTHSPPQLQLQQQQQQLQYGLPHQQQLQLQQQQQQLQQQQQHFQQHLSIRFVIRFSFWFFLL